MSDNELLRGFIRSSAFNEDDHNGFVDLSVYDGEGDLPSDTFIGHGFAVAPSLDEAGSSLLIVDNGDGRVKSIGVDRNLLLISFMGEDGLRRDLILDFDHQVGNLIALVDDNGMLPGKSAFRISFTEEVATTSIHEMVGD